MMLDPSNPIRQLQDVTAEKADRRLSSMLVPAFPAIVGHVFANPHGPSQTGTYISLYPVEVVGNETESSPGELVEDTTRSFAAYVVGSSTPSIGDYLLCRFVGDRWVAERMQGSSSLVSIPGCPCVYSPRTLHMTSSKPSSNFQILQSAVLAYGPTPQALTPLGIGQNAYLSTAPFTDMTTGDQFWYYLYCFMGYYLLTRVYAKSLYGSPYRDSTRYRWPLGLPGNSCAPFLLAQGQIFSGGDPSCVVTISQ